MSCMRTRTILLSTLVLAFVVRPLQLPAASCVLSNGPSHEACKPNCCANKSCCAVSKKSSAPVAPPLVKTGDGAQQLLIGFAPVSVIDWITETAVAQSGRATISIRAHSPPPLAASCIQLI